MTTNDAPPGTPRLPSQWLMTLLLALLSAFPPMAIDQYLPALPEIGRRLGASPSLVQWTMSGFFIPFAAGQLLVGPISDRVGRRPPLFAGIVLFIMASVGCALAPSIGALIAWRAVQGAGAAASTVVSRAVVRDLYEGALAARMLSLVSVAMAIAPLLAPLIGGFLTKHWGWTSNFWFLGLFGAVALTAAMIALPETRPPERRTPMGLERVARNYGCLLATPAFRRYMLTSAVSFSGYFAYLAGSPYVFIDLHHVAPEHYGYLFGLNIVGMASCSFANSRLVTRVGLERMLRYGLAQSAVGGLLLIAVGISGQGGLPAIVAALFVFVASQGLISANATAGALSIRPDIAGAAAGLAGVGAFVLGAFLGALVNALYDGTARPMALTVAAASFVALAIGARRGSPRAGSSIGA